jgi:dihydroneopterin aldolase
MGCIELRDVEFFAYHGCLVEEQVRGSHFVVDVMLYYDMCAASGSDLLADALNYADAYVLLAEEMAVRSCLLEHLVSRVLGRLFERFPMLDEAEVCVAKLSPPVGGRVGSVRVCQRRSRYLVQ